MSRYFFQAAFSVGIGLGIGVGIDWGTALSASAHSVDVTKDVAGTWHIEPDHQPRAGETAQVWVALTRKGGELLPFEQTNCSLGVYDMPRNPSDAPILQPSLRAINAEQYQSIPGADVVFPDTGLYQVELDCQPSAGAPEFAPFKMQYDVTVASGSGRSVAESTAGAAQSSPSAASPGVASPGIASPSAANPSAASPTSSPIASPSTLPIEVPVPGSSPTAANPATASPDAAAPHSSALWVQLVGLGMGAMAALILLGMVGRLFRGKG
ncbi:MAG: hypothetical protein ACKO7W_21465 [Elainella sp.]